MTKTKALADVDEATIRAWVSEGIMPFEAYVDEMTRRGLAPAHQTLTLSFSGLKRTLMAASSLKDAGMEMEAYDVLRQAIEAVPDYDYSAKKP